MQYVRYHHSSELGTVNDLDRNYAILGHVR
jgi:hypothetical protein